MAKTPISESVILLEYIESAKLPAKRAKRATLPACQISLLTNMPMCQHAYFPMYHIFLRSNVPQHVTRQLAYVPYFLRDNVPLR